MAAKALADAASADAALADSSANAKREAAKLSSVDGVISITQDGSGTVLVRSSEKKPAAETPVDEDASLLRALDLTASVQVDYGNEELGPSATTDLVGGAGYAGLDEEDETSVRLCHHRVPLMVQYGAPFASSAVHCTADGSRFTSATTTSTGDDPYHGTRVARQD